MCKTDTEKCSRSKWYWEMHDCGNPKDFKFWRHSLKEYMFKIMYNFNIANKTGLSYDKENFSLFILVVYRATIYMQFFNNLAKLLKEFLYLYWGIVCILLFFFREDFIFILSLIPPSWQLFNVYLTITVQSIYTQYLSVYSIFLSSNSKIMKLLFHFQWGWELLFLFDFKIV